MNNFRDNSVDNCMVVRNKSVKVQISMTFLMMISKEMFMLKCSRSVQCCLLKDIFI